MSQKQSSSPRIALLVLGMHRSGTSLLSGLLAQAGVNLGKDIMDAATDNPQGFWENQRLVDLHDRVLSQFGQSWSSYESLPQGWEQEPRLAELKEELKLAVREEFDNAPLISIKDPRLCRLLPLWRELAEPLDLKLRIVSIVRPAAEVTQSLTTRDGMGSAKARALWLRYNLDMSALSTGLPTFRTSYAAALQHPQQTLDHIASLCDTELTLSNPAFADPALRHHQSEASNDWSSELYEILSSGDTPVPSTFATAIAPLAADNAGLESQLAAAQLTGVELDAEHLQGVRETMLFEQAEDARRYAASMQVELESGRDYIEAMQAELEERQAYATSLQAELALRDDDISRKAEYLAALESELETRAEYVESLQLTLAAKEQDVVAVNQELDKVISSHADDIARREEYTQSLLHALEQSKGRVQELEHHYRHLIKIENILKGNRTDDEQ